MAKVQTGLRVDESIHKKLLIVGQKEKRSVNNIVEIAIDLYLKNYEQEHGPIQEPSQEP